MNFNPDTIVFHTSNSRWGNASIITKWHTFPKHKVEQNGRVYLGNGWSRIGYHYIILNGWTSKNYYDEFFDGIIETGTALDRPGIHVRGHNYHTIGVCLIGKPGLYTDRQLISSSTLVRHLINKYGDLKIKQHSDFDKKKPHCAKLNLEELFG